MRKVLIGFMVVIVALAIYISSAQADGNIGWNGQGSAICPNGAHWVVQAKGAGSVTLYVNGEKVTLGQNGNGSWGGDSTHPFSGTGNVYAEYTGSVSGSTQIELSHCILAPTATEPPASPVPSYTPTEPVATDTSVPTVVPTDTIVPTETLVPTEGPSPTATLTNTPGGPTTTVVATATMVVHHDPTSTLVKRTTPESVVPHTGGGGINVAIPVIVTIGLIIVIFGAISVVRIH